MLLCSILMSVISMRIGYDMNNLSVNDKQVLSTCQRCADRFGPSWESPNSECGAAARKQWSLQWISAGISYSIRARCTGPPQWIQWRLRSGTRWVQVGRRRVGTVRTPTGTSQNWRPLEDALLKKMIQRRKAPSYRAKLGRDRPLWRPSFTRWTREINSLLETPRPLLSSRSEFIVLI
jgi:hypothetical protein